MAFARRFFATQGLLQRSRLVTELTKTPKAKLPNNQLVFGKTFTDHMLEVLPLPTPAVTTFVQRCPWSARWRVDCPVCVLVAIL